MNASIRPVVISDADLLFGWQVDPRIRNYFRNPSPPSWREHIAWIESSLRDPSIALYMILDGADPAGVLRFDRKVVGVFEVSIHIAPEHQNRGLGKAALAMGRGLRPAAEFQAEVLPENAASHSLFLSAGYEMNSSGLYVSKPGEGKQICVIFTNGGPSIGLGHIRRCLGLAAVLQEKGWKIIVLEAPGSNIGYLASEMGCDVVPVASNEGAVAAASEGAQILLIDHYDLDLEVLGNSAMQTGLLVAFDDTGTRALPVDLVINGSLNAAKIDYSSLGASRVLAGIDYQVLRSDLLPNRTKNPEMPPKKLLITIGGGDPLGLTADLLEFLGNRICPYWPELYVDFIIGPYTPVPRASYHPAITCHHAPTGITDLIANADVALSASGQTLMELLYCSVPTVALCLADNQESNIQALDGAGCIISAGYAGRDGWLEQLEQALKQLLENSSLRLKLVSATESMIKGNGAERVVNAMIKMSNTMIYDGSL